MPNSLATAYVSATKEQREQRNDRGRGERERERDDRHMPEGEEKEEKMITERERLEKAAPEANGAEAQND